MPPFRIGKCFLHPSANRLFQFLFIKLILHRRQLSFLTYCSVFYLVCMTSPTLCPLWPSFIIRPVKPMNKLAHAILAWLYTLWVNFSLFFIFFSCTLEFISFRTKLIIFFLESNLNAFSSLLEGLRTWCSLLHLKRLVCIMLSS
jgi:FtsH-binding integral membrane protein